MKAVQWMLGAVVLFNLTLCATAALRIGLDVCYRWIAPIVPLTLAVDVLVASGALGLIAFVLLVCAVAAERLRQEASVRS